MWHFFNRIKQELIALLILVPLAIALGSVLFIWPANDTKEQIAPRPAEGSLAVSPLLMVEESVPAQASFTPAAAASTDKNQAVALVIKSSGKEDKFFLPVEGKITVDQLLRAAQEQNLVQVQLEDYGQPLGVLVTAVNGIANDPQKKFYWYFYVNEQLSQVGVSNTEVTTGDVVEWRYELMKEYDQGN